MKLLTKTTLYFLAAMILLIVVAGFYLFYEVSNEINSRSDKELISDELEWIQYLETQTDNGTSFILRTPDITIYPTDAAVMAYPTLTNLSGYNAKQNSNIPYRQLSQVVSVGDTAYRIVLRQSQEQKAALVNDVTRIMMFVFAGLFTATLLFNYIISNRLWLPFRRTLQKIRSTELHKMEAVYFEQTNTLEFNELNASLNVMADKIYKDFVNMKEFTENAAHEMQTPIAVVQSKLELLLQDTNLSEEQVQSVIQSTQALNRLSKLNQGLLLLAKIENDQYKAIEKINLTETFKKYLSLFAIFITDKQLTINASYESDFITQLHPFLADSLVANLLGNAIKYNYQNGTILIIANQNSISISNTSNQLKMNADKLFSRMNKNENSDEQSNGLGLAIVKKIVDSNELRIDYTANNNINTFTISK
ncbi:MAG: HAMP domain-containing histidine kinase [Bacteroidota bacterium]|nr:HAMP domain-containing histidine kinase [Bacteroidota bacterium]